MKSKLDQIVDYKKDELASLRRKVSLKDVKYKAKDAEPALPFLGKFQKNSINIIAEIKKASPSAGVIREDFNPLDLAFIYQDNGAKALSILTDEFFFQGSLSYLTNIKKQVQLPALRKDFILSDYQIFEARGALADAVLLIAAILDEYQLKDFQSIIRELGMMALIEVHDEVDLTKALSIDPQFIGVNNRDLKTFKTDIEISKELIKKMPEKITKISESGLESHEKLVELKKYGYDGFLIGESLMKEKDVGTKLKELIHGPSLRN